MSMAISPKLYLRLSTNLRHKEEEQAKRSCQHDSSREQHLSHYDERAEPKCDPSQGHQHYTGGVDDDSHPLGVIQDLDLHVPGHHSKDEGRDLK